MLVLQRQPNTALCSPVAWLAHCLNKPWSSCAAAPQPTGRTNMHCQCYSQLSLLLLLLAHTL
jgi:hypothetical protein